MGLSYARGHDPLQSSVKPTGNCMRGLADLVDVCWRVTYLSLLAGTKNNILVNNRAVTPDRKSVVRERVSDTV